MTISIPPNSTAQVFLPGDENDPIDVGSGEWNWSIPYQDPDARGPYTVNDITGEILGDKDAKSIVLEMLDRLNAPKFLRTIMLKERNMPLREALRTLPKYEAVVEMMNQALARE